MKILKMILIVILLGILQNITSCIGVFDYFNISIELVLSYILAKNITSVLNKGVKQGEVFQVIAIIILLYFAKGNYICYLVVYVALIFIVEYFKGAHFSKYTFIGLWIINMFNFFSQYTETVGRNSLIFIVFTSLIYAFLNTMIIYVFVKLESR